MEDQDFRNFKFRSVCRKVLLNAVLLSYRALESVHGARRTKQNKISNFDMVGFPCFLLRERQYEPCRNSKSSFASFFELREPFLENGTAKEQRWGVLLEKQFEI